MDVFRKGATKFREQVVKQQHAVLKQFGGHGSSDELLDEAELQRHQQLERLYASTKAGKHFQREIVRGAEGLVNIGAKQLEVANKLAEECKKYGTVGPVGGALSRGSLHYGTARIQMERERDSLHRVLGAQVAEPLRAMVMGAPLEDARHLTQRYERLRQEAEAQAVEVNRRKTKEAGGNPDNSVKLQAAEQKMGELSSAMSVLGKEAAAAMTAVEAQQQRLTLQRMIAMVEAERAYHQRVAEILDQLQAQMVSERQRSESTLASGGDAEAADMYSAPPPYEDAKAPANEPKGNPGRKNPFFLAEVTHAFEGEDQGELSLNVGDYVVVRQVSSSGWSEGECKGQAGWFPSSYVVRRQRVPGSKVAEVGLL